MLFQINFAEIKYVRTMTDIDITEDFELSEIKEVKPL